MNGKYIVEKINAILDDLDAEMYPETYDYLDYLSNSEEIEETPSEIADGLTELDMPKEFPPYLVDFIKELYEQGIRDEIPSAMNNLGAQYYDGGRGFGQDFAKAFEYYEMAAANGDRQAQENLGYCYYYGRNVAVNYEKAFHYFALGAFDGHLISLYKIGDMYLNGYYVKKNEAEAYRIFSHCLDIMTEEESQNAAGPIYLRLGRLYLYGTGVERDLRSALICYHKAELYLYDMVSRGEKMYQKSYQAAIAGQQMARERMEKELPRLEWDY